MRAAGGIAGSVQLSWDLIEPLRRVGGHLAAGIAGRPARGTVFGVVAVGLGVAAGTRGKKQSAQSLGGTGQLGSGLAGSTLASAAPAVNSLAGERPLTADGRSSVATQVARLETCR